MEFFAWLSLAMSATLKHIVDRGTYSGLLRRSGVPFPDPPTQEKCAIGICLYDPPWSTQPNDPGGYMIEGYMRRVSVPSNPFSISLKTLVQA